MTPPRKQVVSAEVKRRLKIGRAISKQMVSYLPASEVALRLGISRQAVERTECIALFKVFDALQKHITQDKAAASCHIPITRPKTSAFQLSQEWRAARAIRQALSR